MEEGLGGRQGVGHGQTSDDDEEDDDEDDSLAQGDSFLSRGLEIC